MNRIRAAVHWIEAARLRMWAIYGGIFVAGIVILWCSVAAAEGGGDGGGKKSFSDRLASPTKPERIVARGMGWAGVISTAAGIARKASDASLENYGRGTDLMTGGTSTFLHNDGLAGSDNGGGNADTNHGANGPGDSNPW